MNTVDVAVADAATEEAVRNLIGETALRLDREDLAGWLQLFAENSSYEMTSYSPEIRAQMVWWRSGRAELGKQLEELHQHVRDPARRLHLVTPMSVTVAGKQATASSHFAVYRTLPDGESSLFAVGRYEDELALESARWRYTLHRVVLETRLLDAFTHLPL
jgi:3-phenylpropionate/cinnamic acid dioxygenase small subunit